MSAQAKYWQVPDWLCSGSPAKNMPKRFTRELPGKLTLSGKERDMRINYTEDEDFPGQFALWQGNCQRALSGKRGQESLRELESALLALPSKRLIANELDNGEDVCAIGALARYKHLTPFADPESEMEDVGVECGMPRLVAWKVVEINDNEFDFRYVGNQRVDYTPEERYAAILKWVQKQIGEGEGHAET
jgi:hypothetical protein